MFGNADDRYKGDEYGCSDMSMKEMAKELRRLEWNARASHREIVRDPTPIGSDLTSVSSEHAEEAEARSKASSRHSRKSRNGSKGSEKMHKKHKAKKNTRSMKKADDELVEDSADSGSELSGSDSVLERSIQVNHTDLSDLVSVQYGEPTPLYRAIEDEDWTGVLTFLRTDEWGWKCSLFCESYYYNLNEKDALAQARTWVGTTDEEGEICRLPLHAAIVRQAPFQIIQTLTRVYRKGARYPDSDGNYPLHLAFHVGAPLRVLTLLLKEYPSAINKKNSEDLLPDECGVGNEIGDVLRMCIEETRNSVKKEVMKEKQPMDGERKQLIEVTAELIQLKKLVSDRERNLTKEKLSGKKDQLSGAISELTRLKLDLEQNEESLLKTSLQEERKRTQEVVAELMKTKKQLEIVREKQKKMKQKLHKKIVTNQSQGSLEKKPKADKLRLLRMPGKKNGDNEINMPLADPSEMADKEEKGVEENATEAERAARNELANLIKHRSCSKAEGVDESASHEDGGEEEYNAEDSSQRSQERQKDRHQEDDADSEQGSVVHNDSRSAAETRSSNRDNNDIRCNHSIASNGRRRSKQKIDYHDAMQEIDSIIAATDSMGPATNAIKRIDSNTPSIKSIKTSSSIISKKKMMAAKFKKTTKNSGKMLRNSGLKIPRWRKGKSSADSEFAAE